MGVVENSDICRVRGGDGVTLLGVIEQEAFRRSVFSLMGVTEGTL